MERSTGRDENGNLLFRGEQVYAGELYDAVDKLEDYEDTGYTPEQIEALKTENEMLRATMEDERKIKLETMHDFLDKYGIDYDCGWRDAVDKLIASLRAENKQLKADCAVMWEAVKEFCARVDRGEIGSRRTFMEILHATIQHKALNQHK